METLTTTQAAALLNIQPRSVVQLIRRGLLTAEKRGRDYFITRDELERYQRARRPAHRPGKDA